MDVHAELKKWLRTMGFNGEIPEELSSVCNNSTRFVWEQLMQNAHPKNKVEEVRWNIILQRLKNKPLRNQDIFPYKISEIERYRQKVALEQKCRVLEDTVQRKQNNLARLKSECKMKETSLDHLKRKIAEAEERKYLLDKKKEQLKCYLSQNRAALGKLDYITPVSRENSFSASNIKENLKSCALKLEKDLVKQGQLKGEKIPKECVSFQKKKNKLNQSSIATYLSMQEKENFEKITQTCRKQLNETKTNSQYHERVKQRLFTTPIIKIEELNEPRNSPIMTNNSSKTDSLGLLPEHYLDDAETCLVNDNNKPGLLECSNITSMMLNNSDFSCKDNFTPQPSNGFYDSVVFKLPTASKTFKKTVRKDLTQLYCNNKNVHQEVKQFLHSNNRELIGEMLQNCIQNTEIKFTELQTSTKSFVFSSTNKTVEFDIGKLSFIHVGTELRILQQNTLMQSLIDQIGNRKLHLLLSIKEKDNYKELENWLELAIKQVTLEAELNSMQNQLNIEKMSDTEDCILKELFSKMDKVKNEIVSKMQLMKLTIDDFNDVVKDMTTMKHSVQNLIWKIKSMKLNENWIENVWLDNIQMFNSFPLNYQKKRVYTDICCDLYPEDIEMTTSNLQSLVKLFESPFYPPEVILMNIIRAKIKLESLKALPKVDYESVDKIFFVDELEGQEGYVQSALDRMNSLLFSSNAVQTLSAGDMVKQAIDIWLDMPMKDFICSKKVHEGQSYEYYRNKLSGLL